MTAPTVDQQPVEVDQPEHTGGMVALIPTAEDAAKLAVNGGDPAGQLHLTLAYLGDDVTDWDDEIVAVVHEVARKLTDPAATEDDDQPVPADGHDYRGPGQRGSLTLTVFSHSHFNPNGGPDDQEPCMVYQFSGEGDLNRVEALHSDVCWQVKEAIGEVNFPEQHARFQPHVTAGYNLSPDALSYTGPVTFDRLRVALADTVTDYPLGKSSGVVVAAAVKPERVYVDVRASAGDDHDLSAFIQLCKTIQHLSSVGASRDIRVPVDGDGSASLRFDFGDTDVGDVEVPDIDNEIVIGMGN